MITNAYNYLNFPPVPAQILLNLEKLPKRWYYKCIQLLNFFPLACPNLVEFREIAKEVMITNAYNYLNFPPVPAQILLNLEKLQKRWWLQTLTIT